VVRLNLGGEEEKKKEKSCEDKNTNIGKATPCKEFTWGFCNEEKKRKFKGWKNHAVGSDLRQRIFKHGKSRTLGDVLSSRTKDQISAHHWRERGGRITWKIALSWQTTSGKVANSLSSKEAGRLRKDRQINGAY